MKILIIEDHPKIRENIKKYLSLKGFVSETASNWLEGCEKIRNSNYDLIVLDMNMPIMNWEEFMIDIKKNKINIPVIALTSNSLIEDKWKMFNLWVDDYITKPFEFEELIMRINSIMKRKDKKIEEIIQIGNITINLNKHQVTNNWEILKLSNKEYLIIEYLSKNKWYPLSKLSILEKVWWEQEENLELSSTTLEAHISTIRKKTSKEFIKTLKWTWYLIE